MGGDGWMEEEETPNLSTCFGHLGIQGQVDSVQCWKKSNRKLREGGFAGSVLHCSLSVWYIVRA